MHEQSIGIDVGGRFFNLPTVVNGQQISPDQAVQLFRQGKLRPLGQYSTQVEADREAAKRSQQHNAVSATSNTNPPDALLTTLGSIGQGTPQSAEALRREGGADAALNLANSLMGSSKAAPREAAQRQGPALSTLTDTLNTLNPLNFMGGFGGTSGAVIAPTANKTLLAAFDALRTKAPKLMAQIDETARTLFPYLVGAEHMPGPVGRTASAAPYGTFRSINPLAGEMHINDSPALMHELESTIAHEGRHFLTDPRLANKDPTHAFETAKQLGLMMPNEQALALNRYAHTFSPRFYAQNQGKPAALLESLAKPEAFGISPRIITNSDQQLRAYNEALSYLTEAQLIPAAKRVGADPALDAIAEALGQGIK